MRFEHRAGPPLLANPPTQPGGRSLSVPEGICLEVQQLWAREEHQNEGAGEHLQATRMGTAAQRPHPGDGSQGGASHGACAARFREAANRCAGWLRGRTPHAALRCAALSPRSAHNLKDADALAACGDGAGTVLGLPTRASCGSRPACNALPSVSQQALHMPCTPRAPETEARATHQTPWRTGSCPCQTLRGGGQAEPRGQAGGKLGAEGLQSVRGLGRKLRAVPTRSPPASMHAFTPLHAHPAPELSCNRHAAAEPPHALCTGDHRALASLAADVQCWDGQPLWGACSAPGAPPSPHPGRPTPFHPTRGTSLGQQPQSPHLWPTHCRPGLSARGGAPASPLLPSLRRPGPRGRCRPGSLPARWAVPMAAHAPGLGAQIRSLRRAAAAAAPADPAAGCAGHHLPAERGDASAGQQMVQGSRRRQLAAKQRQWRAAAAVFPGFGTRRAGCAFRHFIGAYN